MKKWIAALLALLLLGAAAGCGGPKDPADAVPSESASGSAGAAGTADASDPVSSTEPEPSGAAPSYPEIAVEEVREQSGVLMTDTRVMERYYRSESALTRYANAVNRLQELSPDVRVFCLLAPTAVEFYAPEKYNQPQNVSQKQVIEFVGSLLRDAVLVDPYPALRMHADEYLYFRTDHHWTARGAYYAYLAFADCAEITAVDIDALETGRIDGFAGYLARNVDGAEYLKENPDYVEYFCPPPRAKRRCIRRPP